MQIGTALIGCGKVGHTHAQALASLDESHFVAVFDSDPARAEVFARQYGARAYSDLDAMLSAPDVQMASICAPHPAHADLVLACAQARVHALVEKPMAVDLQGCDRMIQAVDRAGVKLGVVSQRRLYEPVQRVKQAIDDGKIGRPILHAHGDGLARRGLLSLGSLARQVGHGRRRGHVDPNDSPD